MGFTSDQIDLELGMHVIDFIIPSVLISSKGDSTSLFCGPF